VKYLKHGKYVLLSFIAVIALSACGSKASIAAHNLSTQADNFQIARTITFYNSITNQEPLIIKGFCSIGSGDGTQSAPNNGGVVTVTCQTSPGKFIKDFLGLSNNVTYFVSQDVGASVSDTHYQFILLPSSVIPSISVK
jgi:hypothetical protein